MSVFKPVQNKNNIVNNKSLGIRHYSPIKLLVESRRIEPFEHSTSSENETLLLVLDCLLDDDNDDIVEDDDDVLSGLVGTTTGDS